jgi:hypothetical protein
MTKLNAEQFANSGPSPTQSDAMATVVHLADSAAFNHKHGANHLAKAYDLVQGLPPDVKSAMEKVVRGKKTIEWHLEHATKHSIEAGDDIGQMAKHIRTHPAFRPHAMELNETDPVQFGRY